MSKSRFQFEVKEDRADEIRSLMEDTGIESNRDLFNNALTLLEWAVDEVKAGNTIASINEANQVYRELQMPILRSAAARAARRHDGNAQGRSPRNGNRSLKPTFG